MMRPLSGPLVALCIAGSSGCKTRVDEPLEPKTWYFPEHELALLERAPGEILAVNGTTAGVLWKFEIEKTTLTPIVVWPVQTLQCPPLVSPARTVVFRFNHDLRVIALSSGEMKWGKDFRNYLFCPTVTPDSGVVLVTQWGEALEKLDVEGKRVWLFDLRFAGVAVSAPQAIPSSGDVLIQTAAQLVSVNPQGKLSWSLPLSRARDPGAK